MSRIFFDTNVFIYLIERHPEFGMIAKSLVDRIALRDDQIVTSSMTVGEVLVKPIAMKDISLVSLYRKFFDSGVVVIVPFDTQSAFEYAEIRQDKAVKSPDAIQLACAAAAKCDLFVTNDDRLSKKVIPGIQFIVSLDRVPI